MTILLATVTEDRAVISQDTFITDWRDRPDILASVQPRAVTEYAEARTPLISGPAAATKPKLYAHGQKVVALPQQNLIVGWAGAMHLAAAWVEAVQKSGLSDVQEIDRRASALWSGIPNTLKQHGPVTITQAGYSRLAGCVLGFCYMSAEGWKSHELGRGHMVLPVPPEKDWSDLEGERESAADGVAVEAFHLKLARTIVRAYERGEVPSYAGIGGVVHSAIATREGVEVRTSGSLDA